MAHLLAFCCCLFVICNSFVATQSSDNVRLTFVDIKESPDFKIYLSGKEWFRSGPVTIHADNEWWESDTILRHRYSFLKVIDQSSENGEDPIGQFTSYKFTWEAYSDMNTSAGIKVETNVNVYSNEPVVVFGITYLTGLANASISGFSNSIVSTFPSFFIEELELERSYLTWAGNMASDVKISKWSPDSPPYSDIGGGFPLVIFDSSMENTVVLSPLNTFMSANQHTYRDAQFDYAWVTFGPMNTIDTIPAGYKYSTILVGGNNVTGTMRKFGEVLRRFYRKSDESRKTDFSINYLGYWTDNGACYYYTTGSNYSNYEDLLVAVKQDADRMGLPYRYADFRTSTEQPDCHKYDSGEETYPALETYVSALCGGPVGPSDQMGTANATLVMATCMKDGRLLKPTRPAMSLDSTFLQRAFGKGGPDGYVWSAFTEIHGFTWYYVFAAELMANYEIFPSELPPSHSTFPTSSFPLSVAYQYTLDGHVTQSVYFDSKLPLNISKCGKEDFQYWGIAPIMANGLALLGELNKIIPVSETRFSRIENVKNIAIDGVNTTVLLKGVPQETVTVTVSDIFQVTTVDCVIGDNGEAVLSLPEYYAVKCNS